MDWATVILVSHEHPTTETYIETTARRHQEIHFIALNNSNDYTHLCQILKPNTVVSNVLWIVQYTAPGILHLKWCIVRADELLCSVTVTYAIRLGLERAEVPVAR